MLSTKHERALVVGQMQVLAGDDVLVRVEPASVGELDLEHPHESAEERVDERGPIGVLTPHHLAVDVCDLIHVRTLSARVCRDNAPSQHAARISATTEQWYQTDTIGHMAMTLRLTDDQAAALRARAEREGRSMQQVAVSALDEYLLRVQDDELTDRLAARGAERFSDLLRRLGE